MYLTGCRIQESVNMQRWDVTDLNYTTLHPLKRNNQRVFDNSLNFNGLTVKNLILNSKHTIYQYSSLQRDFIRLTKHVNYFHNNKNVSTGLFRHAYVKNKFLEIKNLESVKNDMGHVSIDNTKNYIESLLTY
jgi:site-specific recombinase XerD